MKIEMTDIEYLRWLCLTALLDPGVVLPRPEEFRVSDHLVHYACRQGLAPLLWRRLIKLDPDHPDLKIVPAEVTDTRNSAGERQPMSPLLRESYISTLNQNLRIQQALRELDGALQGTNIPCVVWKGAAISEMVYRDMGLRPMDDIDLLLPAVHLQRFVRILQEMGYAPRPECPLTWHRGSIVVDVHGDVVHSDRIPGRGKALSLNADRMLASACPFPGCHHLVMPCPADTLFCLAVNAMKHGFSRDIWMVDMFLMFDRYSELSAFPQLLAVRADETGTALPLFLLLTAAKQWPWQPPSGLRDSLKLPRMAATVMRAVIDRGLRLPYEGELYYLLMMPSFRDLLAFLRDTLFPSRQVMKQIYYDKPGSWYWIYYPHRFGRLVIKCAGAVVAVFRNGKPG